MRLMTFSNVFNSYIHKPLIVQHIKIPVSIKPHARQREISGLCRNKRETNQSAICGAN